MPPPLESHTAQLLNIALKTNPALLITAMLEQKVRAREDRFWVEGLRRS